MTNEKNVKLEKSQFVEAESIAYLIKDEKKRKKAFLNTCALFALKNYIEKNNYQNEPVTKTNLFRVPAVYEKFEFSDLYIGNTRLDVRVSLDGKIFEIPKMQIKNSLAADFYVVLQPTKNPLKCDILGYIRKDDLVFDTHNEHYYYISTSVLSPIQALKEEYHSLKKPTRNFYETEHKNAIEDFGTFLDGDLDEVRAQDLIEHLLICEECRGTSVEYSFLEDALISVNRYPDIRSDIEKELEKPVNEGILKKFVIEEKDQQQEEYNIIEDFETVDIGEPLSDIEAETAAEAEMISELTAEAEQIAQDETEQTTEPEIIIENGEENSDINNSEEIIEIIENNEEQNFEQNNEEDFIIQEEEPAEPDKYSIVEDNDVIPEIIEEENINFEIQEETPIEILDNESFENSNETNSDEYTINEENKNSEYDLAQDGLSDNNENVEFIQPEYENNQNDTDLEIQNSEEDNIQSIDLPENENNITYETTWEDLTNENESFGEVENNGEPSEQTFSDQNPNSDETYANQIDTIYNEDSPQISDNEELMTQEIKANVTQSQKPKGAIIAVIAVFIVIALTAGIFMLVGKPLNNLSNNTPGEDTKTTVEQSTSTDISQSMTNAFSNNGNTLKVTNVSWEKDKNLELTTELKEYLSALGGAIWDDLDINMQSVQGYLATDAAKLAIKINKKGEVDDIQLTQSCGAEEVDNVILQTVKSASNSMPPSSYSITGKNIKIYLLVNF